MLRLLSEFQRNEAASTAGYSRFIEMQTELGVPKVPSESRHDLTGDQSRTRCMVRN